MNDQDAIVLAVKLLFGATTAREVDRDLYQDLVRGASGIRRINGTMVREPAPSWSEHTRWVVSAALDAVSDLEESLRLARGNKSNAGKHMESYGRGAPWEVKQ